EGSVFDDLHKLKPGDKIYVKDDKGETISFVMRGSERYDPQADAADVFNSKDIKSHLNLVTCEGVWNEVAESYPKRLVVFADKE
ncbi:MAG: class F sortase, partial [Candidatus Komeilibacteria bacterium]|nr:class F sortase [Candidatus Komeilibacteria bacterium]